MFALHFPVMDTGPVEQGPGLAYESYCEVIDADNGRVPVCVPLIDSDGIPAVLTTQYTIEGFDSMKDYKAGMPSELMVWSLIRMMHISRETIVKHGGTPLEDAT